MNAHTETAQNPFIMEWTTPFQTPPFDQIKDELVHALLEKVKAIDKEAEEQGIHEFEWNIEKMV